MKLLCFLTVLYLVVPGSGQMVWDGIPFSTRAEFAGLILLILAWSSRNSRRYLLETSRKYRFNRFLAPALVLLCVVKLATFAWSPLSAGFASCYRSNYEPLADERACEKSFEAPFIRGHGLPIAKISRVDSKVDFGANMYDWRLPFINEFHRFPNQWISRFPFSVRYEARINTPTEERDYLPIRAIGDLTVRVGESTLIRESNYDREYLAVIKLPKKSSNVRFEYQFTDDGATKLPDVAPIARGPYAQLKIGEPQTEVAVLSRARVLVLGQFPSGSELQGISGLSINDSLGRPISFVDKRALPGSAGDSPPLRKSFDIELEIQATNLDDGPISMKGVLDDQPVLLATIDRTPGDPFSLVVRQGSIPGIDVSAVLTTGPESFPALRPGLPMENPALFRLLLAILDVAALAICASGPIALLRRVRVEMVTALLFGTVGWMVIYPFYGLLPSFLGGGRELALPYLILSSLAIAMRRSIANSPLLMLTPISTVLAVQKVFDHLTYDHPGEGNDWWGKLIFMWRDSDWYVNHGNARQIFVDSFFRGGEDVFWARTGPRYLIFFGQFLLGENDILIGIISVTAGFLVLAYLTTRFANVHDDRVGRLLAILITFMGMILLGDQIITAFGFLVTSEFTTWVGIFGVLAFLLGKAREQRLWVTNLFAAIIATLIHFRPNILFVCIAFLLLVIIKAQRVGSAESTGQVEWALAIFVAIVPLSLIHNLFYGGRFVPFTENSAETVAIHKRFSWLHIWSDLGFRHSIAVIWEQTRIIMYWGAPSDPNLAIAFWGAQLTLVAALLFRHKLGVLVRAKTLVALLPITYVAPMVSYNLDSYFPRHIVTANLLCLGAAMLIWPGSRSHRQLLPDSGAAEYLPE